MSDKGSVPQSPVPGLAPDASRQDMSRDRDEAGLRAVLRGAGLGDVEVTPELAQNFGRILRVVVAGVMDLLEARSKFKNEFRREQTIYGRADNNPLKYSVNVDDALHNLLVKRLPAYLGPVEAFEGAFDDVKNHQLAILEGMRAAFEAMLAEFDPARLQEDFDKQSKKGALLPAPARLRYWELYRQRFDEIVKDPERSFNDLFGDEFCRAYDEQLERLDDRGRTRKR